MLRIKNLHATFEDSPILRGVDLEVRAGETHALLGPNGAGKSTLGHVLIGDPRYKQTKGSVAFKNAPFDTLEPHERARAGFFLSFQSPPALDGVSARELLLAARKAMSDKTVSSFRFRKELIEQLEHMRLGEDFAEREMNKGASGGERRKMEMVSLFTLNPKCAFLDEIDSGIDVDALQAIARGMNEFREDKTKSLILISHTHKLLQLIPPTHVHVMVGGKIVESGGVELVEKIHKDGFDAYLPRKNTKSKLKVISP